MRFIITLLLIINFLSAGDKIALLIGNNDYSFQPLANPLNDVDGIYKTLRAIGFEKSDIKVLKNASKTKMETALANFSQRASSAEIALVYFSGHGMQVNNTNYMFPAKANPTKPVDLFGLVDLNYFIQSASSAKYGIILVDACRTNPLVKYFQNGKHKGLTAKKGLGQVTPSSGQVVIGFATSAGDTADDGNGNMSPYAKALSERLKEPNKDITKVLGLVALDVSAKYEQKPIIRTNLAYDVCLCESSKKEKFHWITPNNKICFKYKGNIQGTYNKEKICNAKFSDATRICKALDSRLPTLKEFESLVIACKGSITENNYSANKNESFKLCVSKKGIYPSDYYGYWSSNTEIEYLGDKNEPWNFSFNSGGHNHFTMGGYNFVRCIQNK